MIRISSGLARAFTLPALIAPALIGLTVLGGSVARAADSNGSFGADGIGGQPCKLFTDAADRKDQVMVAAFSGWVGGYATAYNALTPDTFDITPWQSSDLILAKLDRHCRAFPDKPFVEAVAALYSVLHPARMTQPSPIISMSAGGKTQPLPAEVLSRVRKLIESDRGQPLTTPEGTFDDAFSKALVEYQTQKGLPQSGLADQPTLNALFP